MVWLNLQFAEALRCLAKYKYILIMLDLIDKVQLHVLDDFLKDITSINPVR